MSMIPLPCPGPPAWSIDWEATVAAAPWLRRLQGCPQDREYHGEGDVLVHTRLACEALCGLPGWRGLSEAERQLVFAACLLHDIGKLDRTRVGEDGRVRTHGHSARGACLTRQILMEIPQTLTEQTGGRSFSRREQVVALVRHHNLPLFAFEGEEPARQVIAASQTARCDLLALLAEADVLGRVSADRQELLDRVALFRELCSEQGCLDRPRAFPSAHARFIYFRGRTRDPDLDLFDPTRCEVVLMSGLPGAGKDHWTRSLEADLPAISLDALRKELKIPPDKNQGRVVAAARERARTLLRRGQPFIYNATNVTRKLRSSLIDLFFSYRARTRLVYVEPPSLDELLRRNRARAEGVPEAVVRKLLLKLSVPDLTEAHQVDHVVD